MSQSWPKSRLLTVAGWLALALVGIPATWPATMARWLAFGPSARLLWPALTVALALAFAALSAFLANAPEAHAWRRRWVFTIAAVWCLTHTLGWQCQTSSFSAPGIGAAYLLTTLWIGACAFFVLSGLPRRSRVKLFAVALVSLVVGVSSMHCEGLDGSGRPMVGWRFQMPESVAAASDVEGALRLDRVAFRSAKGRSFAERETSITVAGDYPAFRGKKGSGVVCGVKLSPDWQASPPRLLWRQAIGRGWSGFAVVGPWAYTHEQRGADECVVCYETVSGRECWMHADRTGFSSEAAGDGPRATPTVCNGRIYTLGATGRLNCLDALTGQRRWSVDVLADNDAGNLYHGLSGSPLVVHDRVIVSVGGPGRSLVAYHARTGERRWRAGDDAAGYGSPLVCLLADREQILILNQPGLAAHDPTTGRILWQFPWTNGAETNCSQPALVGADRLLLSTGYGKGCTLLRVSEDSGGWSAEPLWTSRSLRTKFSSAVIRDGYAFGLDEGALACVDLADGKRRWKAGRYGHGQLLLVDDVLLVQCEDGHVPLVAADPTAHRELGRLRALDGKTWNYPALAGRLLLVRNDHEAACFALTTYAAADGE